MRPTSLVAALVILAAVTTPGFAAAQSLLNDAFPPGHPSCHVRIFDRTEPTRKDRRITSIALERLAHDVAAERKWAAREQFDDTPVVSVTLRVRLRGEPISHLARLECSKSGDRSLVCTTPACAGGEIRMNVETQDRISVSIGGTLKNGRFVGHHIHLDESCEGRRGGALVLESGDDNRRFDMAPAPREACR